ncbi:MAG: endonuclease I family protein [Candidatus Muiribacteriota bacterium]
MKKFLSVALVLTLVLSVFAVNDYSGVYSLISKNEGQQDYKIVDEIILIPQSQNEDFRQRTATYTVESLNSRMTQYFEFVQIDGDIYAVWKDDYDSAIYLVEHTSDFELKLTNIDEPDDVFYLVYDKTENDFDYGQYYSYLEQLESENLKQKLHELVKNHHYLGYTGAREEMFGHIDNENGYVEGVYTGKVLKTSSIPNHTIMNCEHTWPQSKFGSGYSSSKKSDLFHLYPTDSKANSRRGSYHFGEVVDVYWSDGGSKLGEDKDGYRKFEPKDDHKGNVARSIFYFSVRYNLSVPHYEEEVLRKWHEQDPVDEEELMRNSEIEEIQRNRNPFIDNPDYVSRIDDF